MRAILLALSLLASSAQAGTIGMHLGSFHPGRPDLNPINPGLYYRAENGFTVGGYWNSIRKPSFYAGMTFGNRYALTVGAISGYSKGGIEPLLIPSLSIGHWRMLYVPKFEKHAQTLHLTYEW